MGAKLRRDSIVGIQKRVIATIGPQLLCSKIQIDVPSFLGSGSRSQGLAALVTHEALVCCGHSAPRASWVDGLYPVNRRSGTMGRGSFADSDDKYGPEDDPL